MSNMECAEKFCKDCLDQIPEEEREAIIQNLEKLNQAIEKGLENCCQSNCNCPNIKEK